MSEPLTNNRRIAKNTIYLYIRMLFSLVVSLYTSRVILHALGAVDYGINNVVGGVVTMFAFLSGTMSTATQRFLSFEMGQGNREGLKKTFEASNTLIILLAVVIIILVEIIGLWLLNNKLVIPNERMIAAQWVFQFATAALLLQILSVPYSAAIIAHEKMSAFAFIGIFDVILKLVIALLIQYAVGDIDKLIFYSASICGISILMRTINVLYCKKQFEECRNVKIKYEKETGSRMLSFFGWNTIGAFSWVAKEQGVNIVINMFCGPAVNAARGINSQVMGAINGFITNFQVAMNPQITKSYAAGDYTALFNLVFRGAKFSFFLFMFLAIPVFLDIDYILSLWLVEVPEHTANFIRLTILLMAIETVSSPIITSLLAIGNVKTYQIVVGTLLLLNLPLSYFALKLGFEPEITVVIAIVLSVLSLLVRLCLIRSYAGFPVMQYFKKVLLRCLIVAMISILGPLTLMKFLKISEFPMLIIVCIISFIVSGVTIFFVGTDKNERPLLLGMVKKIFHRK